MSVITALVICTVWIGWHGAIRGWELQHRLICAANLKAIGAATRGHAHGGGHSSEAMLEGLVAGGRIDRRQTICPSSGLSASNYVWVLRDAGTATAAGTVIAYEPKSNHGGEGGCVLFADGHVMFVLVPHYDELVGGTLKDPR